MERHEYLELLDWRRRVAALFGHWREASTADPEAATADFRLARDELFRSHPQSPVPAGQRDGFSLDWWPFDPAYRLTARLEPETADPGPHGERPSADGTGLPWSGPSQISLRRVGWLSLSGPLSGQRLAAYWVEGYAGGLFVPFRDATSGSETYGAGRYLLDTIKSADHGVSADDPTLLVLDFNLAFHPSCAYDTKWSCPLAPRENWLPAPVRIGERLPSGG